MVIFVEGGPPYPKQVNISNMSTEDYSFIGKYEMVLNTKTNNRPVWKHEGGKSFLYYNGNVQSKEDCMTISF